MESPYAAVAASNELKCCRKRRLVVPIPDLYRELVGAFEEAASTSKREWARLQRDKFQLERIELSFIKTMRD
jgi:hypothetical protein